MSSTGILPLLSIILITGVAAKALGDRYGLPSIIFLLIAGIIFGPSGIGIITQETFGSSLSALVGFAVAIIVFEGAFNLKTKNIRQATSTTFRLVTIGALIALVGTSVAVKFLLNAPWDISFLIGSLLVATGPTVITPILSVVSVPKQVETAMETEGIVNDVTAAILAVVVFEAVVLSDFTPQEFFAEFIQRMGVGVLVGVVGSAIIYYSIKMIVKSENASQNSRLVVLVGAIGIFTVANTVASEAGVASVAVAGIILGNVDLPYEEDIEEFKGDITPVVLSLTFITLAALVKIPTILALGLGGLGVVLLIIFVIRPLLVFISAFGSSFTRAQKLFISFVGPRGIIPASVATLFAVKLGNEASSLREKAATSATENASGSFEAGSVCTKSDIGQEAMRLCGEASTFTAGADLLVSTVFLVIFTTVLLQAGPAKYIAEALNVMPMRVIIVGGGTAGKELADNLASRDEDITIVEINEGRVEELRKQGYSVVHGDGTDSEVLREAGAEKAKILAAMTKNDDANLLAAKLGDVEFEVETVMSRVNNPERVDTFEKLGVRTVAAPSATATAVDNLIERPVITDWMDDLKDRGDVQDVTVSSDEIAGMTIEELGDQLPENVIVSLILKDGESKVPTANTELNAGDQLTLMGERESVDRVVDMIERS